MEGKDRYSGEICEVHGFTFVEISPKTLEAHKTQASIKFPSNDGRLSASAVYDVYRSFFISSCSAWNHAEGKECSSEEKARYYDECFEHAFNVAYTAAMTFKARRVERGKKLVAGSQGQGERL